MLKAFNFTTTKKDRWLVDCLHWLGANQPSEVRDVKREHLAHSHDLCSARQYRYQYQFRSDKSAAIFTPVR